MTQKSQFNQSAKKTKKMKIMLFIICMNLAALSYNIAKLPPSKILSFRFDQSCKGCVHYIEKKGKCKKFLTTKDSFMLEYDDALKCRLDASKCGLLGKYYVEKH